MPRPCSGIRKGGGSYGAVSRAARVEEWQSGIDTAACLEAVVGGDRAGDWRADGSGLGYVSGLAKEDDGRRKAGLGMVGGGSGEGKGDGVGNWDENTNFRRAALNSVDCVTVTVIRVARDGFPPFGIDPTVALDAGELVSFRSIQPSCFRRYHHSSSLPPTMHAARRTATSVMRSASARRCAYTFRMQPRASLTAPCHCRAANYRCAASCVKIHNASHVSYHDRGWYLIVEEEGGRDVRCG